MLWLKELDEERTFSTTYSSISVELTDQSTEEIDYSKRQKVYMIKEPLNTNGERIDY